MTKTTLAVIALVLGTASTAFAIEFEPNQQNRYPQAGQVIEGRNAAVTIRRAPVAGPQSYFDRATMPLGGSAN